LSGNNTKFDFLSITFEISRLKQKQQRQKEVLGTKIVIIVTDNKQSELEIFGK